MASTNQSPFYKQAEQKFLSAQTDEERLIYLQEMIKECPKHKSSENMLANLKTRNKKLSEKIKKKSKKTKKQGIKKADMQAIIIGMPNAGKSSIFQILTNQETKTSPNPFATTEPKLGTLNYEDVKIQIIDMPPFPNHDPSLINSTDTLLFVIDNIEQINQSEQFLKKSNAKLIIIFNKSDLLNENEKRKISSSLQTKKQNFIPLSAKTKENLEELKQKIFESFPIIRIYTKEPRKQTTKIPMILKQNSSVQDIAEKILKGLSQKIKKIKIWGPSSKFPGQTVGLEHILKDKDTVEFQTK